MTERREKIVGLLHRQAQMTAQRIGARISDIRGQELSEFDLADRIGQLLDQAAQGKSALARPGEITSAHFMDRTLMAQLSATRAKGAALSRERAALEAELQRATLRQRILEERHSDLRRSNQSARDAAQEAANLPRSAKSPPRPPRA